ncbi:MAG: response regulator transcription factor [Cyanobacteria bacterium SZAS LIN-2]|nr:response regulator transcription factor [Cyanobacteria bacterium SZAS LIN-3]MBS1995120.1 response regulator transcription factor [Cyanobacteria bacterium SZAS LIN-2]
MAKILFVDDDKHLAAVVSDWLTGENHVVDVVNDGLEAASRLQFYSYDLIILDLTMPGMDGMEVCKKYRAEGGKAPIIMLTGRNETEQKMEGLDSGADDYQTKPFEMRELGARVRALLRRPQELVSEVITAGPLKLDVKAQKVTRNNVEIRLLPQQMALLEFFMRHPGEIFSSETLLDRIWSSEADTSPDTVRVHITRIRQKIDEDGQQSFIRTMHRVGYCFEPNREAK